MSQYVYREMPTKPSEPTLWTVGHYDPQGTWHPDSDHLQSREAAAERVAWLNGGGTLHHLQRMASKIADLTLEVRKMNAVRADIRALLAEIGGGP